MIQRRKTRQLQLGKVKVGGGAPITVQSMTKTDTRDVDATVDQIWALEVAGCDIVRVAVPVREAAEQLGKIKKQIRIPLVADIHFNYKLALIALEQGVDGLRLNPGNIGARWCIEEVVKLAAERKIPIRIGVNAGSLEKDLLQKYGGPTAAGMVESGLRHIRILEELNYPEIKISLKASDPLMTIEAYRMLADKVDYPFHLGVTEAGTPTVGTVKSAVGLGTLLAEGIGDTIRVSLAADPVEEVRIGAEILRCLGLKKDGMTLSPVLLVGELMWILSVWHRRSRNGCVPTATLTSMSRLWVARSTDPEKRARPILESLAAKASVSSLKKGK